MEKLLARLAEIAEELETLHGDADDDGNLDEEQTERFNALETEFSELDEKREAMLKRLLALKRVQVAATDPRNVEQPIQRDLDQRIDIDNFAEGVRDDKSDLWDLDELRAAPPADLMARAKSAAEQGQGFSTRDREGLTGWVECLDAIPDDEADLSALGKVARHIVVTSSPEYNKQWMRALRSGHKYGEADPDAVKYLLRVQSLTDAEGGFGVPQQLDAALILTSDGSTNPFRQLGRSVIATGDVWTGLSAPHAAWSNDAEAAEVSDDAVTFAQPTVAVHKAQVFIPFSIEIDMDYPGFQEDLRTVIAGGKDDLDATNMALGTGTGQPFGIVTAIDGTANDISTSTTDALLAADIYTIEETLGERYLVRAEFVANRAIYNIVRQLDTTGGTDLWVRLAAGIPPELIGYPAHKASAMDGTITALAENNIIVFGDWRNYVIADRLGMTLELIPHLFATGANRPSGERGLYGYARTGADSVNDAAFVLLNAT